MQAYHVGGAQDAHATQITASPVHGIGSLMAGNRKAVANLPRWLLCLST